jgi:hypothetical protein
MKTLADATRRAFLKGSALIAAPLAVAAAPAAMAMGADDSKDRLARLEDIEAVRALHRDFVAHVNARRLDAAAALFADPAKAALDSGVTRLAAEAETVTLSDDRQSATLTAACAVSTETAIESDCTLAQMARLQGDGVIRAVAARGLSASFVKLDGAWRIGRVVVA